MRGDDAVDSAFVELAEYRFRNRASGGRFRARPEFVYQDQCLRVGMCQHVVHRSQERAVCTQVIVNGLAVADVCHYPVEDHHFGCLGGRDEHAPLEHVLEQAYGFQTHGLASGVRSGDEQNVLLRGKFHCQRNDFLAVFFQGPFQKRMSCLAQVHLVFFGYYRHSGHEIK